MVARNIITVCNVVTSRQLVVLFIFCIAVEKVDANPVEAITDLRNQPINGTRVVIFVFGSNDTVDGLDACIGLGPRAMVELGSGKLHPRISL